MNGQPSTHRGDVDVTNHEGVGNADGHSVPLLVMRLMPGPL